MTSRLVARGLTKRFGDLVVLDGVSLDLDAGVKHCVLGRNGSGKSTLLNICVGILGADSGTVKVDGKAPRDAVRDAEIGVALQFVGLDPMSTVRTHVELDIACRSSDAGDALASTNGILDRLGLVPLLDAPVGALSGGQQRRVSLALALGCSPSLLVFDEPTVGLDPQSRQAFWLEVRAAAAGGTSILFSTQLVGEAEEQADLVSILHDRQLRLTASPDAILDRHGRHRVVADLVDLAVIDDVALPEGSRVVSDRTGDRVEIWLNASASDRELERSVAQLIGLLGRRARSVRTERPSLEGVFLDLTGHEIVPEFAEEALNGVVGSSHRAIRAKVDV